jgi:hypothetical protein
MATPVTGLDATPTAAAFVAFTHSPWLIRRKA